MSVLALCAFPSALLRTAGQQGHEGHSRIAPMTQQEISNNGHLIEGNMSLYVQLQKWT